MKFRRDKGLPLLAGHIIKNIVPLQSAYLMGIMEKKEKKPTTTTTTTKHYNKAIRGSHYQNQGQAQLHLVWSLIHSPLFW